MLKSYSLLFVFEGPMFNEQLANHIIPSQAAIYDVCSGCFRYSKTAIIKNASYQSLPAAYAGLDPIIFHNSFATHGPQTILLHLTNWFRAIELPVKLCSGNTSDMLQNTHKQMQTRL